MPTESYYTQVLDNQRLALQKYANNSSLENSCKALQGKLNRFFYSKDENGNLQNKVFLDMVERVTAEKLGTAVDLTTLRPKAIQTDYTGELTVEEIKANAQKFIDLITEHQGKIWAIDSVEKQYTSFGTRLKNILRDKNEYNKIDDTFISSLNTFLNIGSVSQKTIGDVLEYALGVFGYVVQLSKDNAIKDIDKFLEKNVVGGIHDKKVIDFNKEDSSLSAIATYGQDLSKLTNFTFEDGGLRAQSKRSSQNKIDVTFSTVNQLFNISAKNVSDNRIHLVHEMPLIYPFVNLMQRSFQMGYFLAVYDINQHYGSKIQHDFSDLLKRGTLIAAISGEGHSEKSANVLVINKDGHFIVYAIPTLLNYIINGKNLIRNMGGISLTPEDFDKQIWKLKEGDFNKLRSAILIGLASIKIDASITTSALSSNTLKSN